MTATRAFVLQGVVAWRVVAALIVLVAGVYSADPVTTLCPDQPYKAVTSHPVTHDVEFRAIVTPPYRCQQLRVWLPLPQTDAAQEVLASSLSTFPESVEPKVATEPVFGNKFACFTFDRPHGAQIISHEFRVRVWDLDWNVDPARAQTVTEWPETFGPYLKPQTLARQAELTQVLHEIIPASRGTAGDLRSVLDWVDQHLEYDHVRASLQADANHALEYRRGHCSDYHGLCATMGRTLGVPARVTYGLNLFPKNSPSHCKLEAFLPPYGWVSYDVSETQKLIGKIAADTTLSAERRASLTAAARQRLHQGFRENSWLLLTRGTDYELAPPASKPVRVVRTIYAEADGVPLAEPDPANPQQRQFSWMTSHRYRADAPFSKPFEDFKTLAE